MSNFEELLKQAEKNRANKQGKKGRQQMGRSSGPFTQMNVRIPDKKDEKFDFSFECGCFGTNHPAINNCMNCGRIICQAEGERPCPYCGTPVFSDETLENPERMEMLTNKFEELAKKTGWVPVCDRDLTKSVPAKRVDTKVVDLETDWFSNEIAQIYGIEIEEEEEEEEKAQDDEPILSD